MASSMWAPTIILTSLPSVSLGFIVPGPLSTQRVACSNDDVRPSSTSIAAFAACPHVATTATNQPVPSLTTQQRLGKWTSLHMSSSAEVEEGMSMATEEGKRWAEENFPGCSTIVSTATRLSGVLAEVWETLADASAVDAGKPRVIMFPECPAVADARGLQGMYEHLEVCQDACERFGTAVSIVPHPKRGDTGAPAPALVVQVVAGSGGGDEFGYDEDWDGDWDIDRSLLDDDDDDFGGGDTDEVAVDAAALGVVPNSDEEVTELTKSWVQAVITDMGVCPFSVDASRAGLPIGQVRYPVTRETTAESIYREYWREVELLVSEKDERSLSTTLLITPEFALSNAEAFEVIGQTLTQPLEALHLEDDIQLVFFHPQYAFRDGRDRIGSGGAANFARRSPFPMINILRTNQVRLAQKSIPTGLVYKQNEEVLEAVGVAPLQKMLETRDWAGLEGKKIDRKNVDYYETARKLQGVEVGGVVPQPDAGDSRSAAPKSEPEKEPKSRDTGSRAPSAEEMMGARESLSEAAAGSVQMSFNGEGYASSGGGASSSSQEEDSVRAGQSASAAVAAQGGGVGKGAAASAALSSIGIAEEDLRGVATALVKRMSTGVALTPDVFEEFSAAVDGVLRETQAP